MSPADKKMVDALTRAPDAQKMLNYSASTNIELMELAKVIGDLIFRNGDFPGADKIIERFDKADW